MRLVPLTVLALVFVVQAGSAQATCKGKGVERWTVKTTAPKRTTAKNFLTGELVAVPAPQEIDEPKQHNRPTRYPTPIEQGLHEGDLVSVTGWVQHIKTDGGDCDYHIELTADRAGKHDRVIVEVPEPDAEHVKDETLRDKLDAARQSILTLLKMTKEPSRGGVDIQGHAYVTFTGALFFDGTHYPSCGSRGTRPDSAATCWELHPVVAAKYATRPN